MISHDSGDLDYVDAIDDGKIVRVHKDYARKEGLFILRKSVASEFGKSEQKGNVKLAPGPNEGRRVYGKSPLDLDKYRKPLDYLRNDVVSELIENFHWEIIRVRKLKNLTRKQLAGMLNVEEDQVKMIENGILPKNDFVLIARIENILGINLRKSKIEYEKKMREEIERRDEARRVFESEQKDKIDVVEL